MRRDAPHCLIKQKVDLFKSNFAQGLGGVEGRGGQWGRDQQTGPGAEKGTAGPSEAVKCMLNSLKRWEPAPRLPLIQWRGGGSGQGKVRQTRLLLGAGAGTALAGTVCPLDCLGLLQATDRPRAGSLELKESLKHKSQTPGATRPKAGGCLQPQPIKEMARSRDMAIQRSPLHVQLPPGSACPVSQNYKRSSGSNISKLYMSDNLLSEEEIWPNLPFYRWENGGSRKHAALRQGSSPLGLALPLLSSWPGWTLSPGPGPRALESPCLGDLSQSIILWLLFSLLESPRPAGPSGSPWAGKAARQQIWAQAWAKSKTLPAATAGLPCARVRPGSCRPAYGCNVTQASGHSRAKMGTRGRVS